MDAKKKLGCAALVLAIAAAAAFYFLVFVLGRID